MNHHEASGATPQERKGGKGHGWMMIACCIPMLAIAIALVATGVLGVGFIAIAVLCTAMMALMMRGMAHFGGGEKNRSHAGDHE